MTIRAALYGLAFAAVSSSASAAESSWYLLTERLGYIYFADDASAVRSGQTVELEFLQGNLDSPPDGEHVLLRYRIDCARRKLQLLGGRVFMDDGGEIPDLALPGAPIGSDVGAVSPGEAFYGFACSQEHRQTRVEDPFRQIREARAAMDGDHVDRY